MAFVGAVAVVVILGLVLWVFILLLCFSTVFVAQFVQEGLEFSRVPAFGESYRTMLGSIIFNYAFIVMVPSWLNEKRAEVSVNKTVWTATITSTILYLAGGNSQKSASLLHL